jgi:hypothetical protein
MDSQPGIGGGPNKRITRSWYPGGQASTRRTTRPEAAAPSSNGTSGLGADVGYWGRVDSQGEFKENSGFLEPSHPSRFPWRSLFVAVRRILPLSAAALVGAVTALAWQSFLVRPAQTPAGRPIPPVPAAQGVAAVRTTNATERPPADLSPVRGSAPAPAIPAPARPVQPPLLGSAPPLPESPSSSEVERSPSARPINRPALLGRPRSPAVKVNPVRAARPTVTPAHRGQASDPDAILRPTFM